MNRMQLRKEAWPAYPQISILEICQNVHSSVTGASDPIPNSDLKKIERFFLVCEATWDESRHKFDDLVLGIVRETFKEIGKFLTK